MKWNDKTKKMLVMFVCLLVVIGLVIAIFIQMQKPKAKKDVLPENTEPAQEVLIDLKTDEKEELQGADVKTGMNEDVQEEDNLPPQTDEPKQQIQSDPVKPEASEDALSDPTQTPDGEVQETPPVAVEHEQVVQPEESPTAADAPQGGETKNGQIYVPGFGWIEDVGNAKGSTAGDMLENGNKIGIMD